MCEQMNNTICWSDGVDQELEIPQEGGHPDELPVGGHLRVARQGSSGSREKDNLKRRDGFSLEP